MDPFYFGTPPELFGVFHPFRGPVCRGALLLCAPLGHEYVRAHRAYRNLAIALSRSGFAVLRFDYAGAGDSGGEPEDGDVTRWGGDIDTAVVELRARSGVTAVSLLGLRFGATLAALASTRHTVERLLLWDPVLQGAAYLDELAALQVAWLDDRLGAAADAAPLTGELLGMPVPERMRDGIAAIDLVADPTVRARHVHVITSTPSEACTGWTRSLEARGMRAECVHVSTAGGWSNPESVHQLLLPHEAIRHLVTVAASA